MTTPPHPLADIRVLLLEDNFLIALELGDQLRDLGASVDGPHASIAAARAACRQQLPRIALLDVHVRDGASVTLGRELVGSGVAVVFVTGYSSIQGLSPDLVDVPQLRKPVTPELLDEVLRACLAVPTHTPRP